MKQNARKIFKPHVRFVFALWLAPRVVVVPSAHADGVTVVIHAGGHVRVGYDWAIRPLTCAHGLCPDNGHDGGPGPPPPQR